MIINKLRILLTVMILSLFMMACGLMELSQPGAATASPNAPTKEENTPSSTESSNSTQSADTPVASTSSPTGESTDQSAFPLPPNTMVISSNADITTAQVKLSSDEVVAFYRQELTKQGLVEDPTFTQIVKPTFNLEFKGSKNGKMLIVQGTELGDGSVAFTIRYE
jgi:hypothetical protein